MFKARGQPGCWYGYAELDGVTYKIDARHVGKGTAKHFEGTIKRHLKSDQRALDLRPHPGKEPVLPATPVTRADFDPDLNDVLPEFAP